LPGERDDSCRRQHAAGRVRKGPSHHEGTLGLRDRPTRAGTEPWRPGDGLARRADHGGRIPGKWPVKLMLADPHRLVIESLAVALTRRGFAVVALATSAPEALARVAEHQPDICLLATDFPLCSSLDVLRIIIKRHPRVKPVLLSASRDSRLMAAAMEAGAAGFIPRDCHIIDIVRVLPRVHQGERVFDRAVLEAGAGAFRLPGDGDGDWLRGLLTSREQEVLMQIATGEDTHQISRSLAITEATVRTHVQNVLVKLGVHSRLEASTVLAESGALGHDLHGIRAMRAAGGE
jgi:two-component system nitrate/nitrite response regulator NarL